MENQKTQTEEQKEESRTTNKKYSENNEEFRTACEIAGIHPSTRQASKWRSKKGKAWAQGRVATA